MGEDFYCIVIYINHKALSAKNTTGFNIFKVQVYLT